MTTTSASARQADGGRPRRALVFAGGGLKVAYQAGAVQVLLDEAQIDFDLADGASGGVFNLAMWCQGMTGRQIADNWRSYRPLGGFSPNLRAWLRGPWAASALTDSGLRRRGLTGFGLDWHAIRSTQREAVFELFNVSLAGAAVGPGGRDHRGPPAVRGRAADVVPARPHRRRHLHRCGIRHRREPGGDDPPRRERAVGDLDRQYPGPVGAGFRGRIFPDDRGGRQ